MCVCVCWLSKMKFLVLCMWRTIGYNFLVLVATHWQPCVPYMDSRIQNAYAFSIWIADLTRMTVRRGLHLVANVGAHSRHSSLSLADAPFAPFIKESCNCSIRTIHWGVLQPCRPLRSLASAPSTEKPYSRTTQKNLEKGKFKFFSLVFDSLF